MKTTITAIMCATLIALPLHAQEKEGKPGAEFLAQVGIALLVVAVVGTSIYVVHKCNKASEDHCYHCDTEVPEDETVCAYCGYPFRCEVCNTEIGEDDTNCSKCGERVPDPVPVMNSVQMSANGTDWSTIIHSGHQKYGGIEVRAFATQRDFDHWLAAQNATMVDQVEAPGSAAFFRLANE